MLDSKGVRYLGIAYHGSSKVHAPVTSKVHVDIELLAFHAQIKASVVVKARVHAKIIFFGLDNTQTHSNACTA